MVLPLEMFRAAQSGDRDAVLAYLYPQDDSGDARDVNEQTEEGGSILMGAVSQIDSAAKLAFVWELVRRGADLAYAPWSRAVTPHERRRPRRRPRLQAPERDGLEGPRFLARGERGHGGGNIE